MSVKIFDKAQNKWVIFPGSIGAPGRSAYELAVQQGYKGTLDEWLKSIKGADGRDAYTIAVEGGYKGTEEEYNNALTIAPVAVDKINNADTTPTKDSTNLVLSGGVKDAIDSLNSDFNADLATINSSITNLSDEIDNIVNVEIGDQLKSSIIDNLTSSDTEKALSARQGKILKELIDNLANLQITVVDTLPTTGESNIIYLVKKAGTGTDIHDEYVFVDGKWEKIGDTEIDLSNYYTRDEVDDKLTGFGAGDVIAAEAFTTADRVITSNGPGKTVKDSGILINNLALKSYVDEKEIAWDKVTGKPETYVPAAHTHPLAQITDAGALAYKDKVDESDLNFDIPDGTVVDSSLSTSSVNPVQNKVVTEALNNRYTKSETYSQSEIDEKIGSAGGGDVMASGNLAVDYIIIGAGPKSIKNSGQTLSNLALKSEIPSLSGYATQSWVTGQGYSTENTWRPVKVGSTTLNDSSTTLTIANGTGIGLSFSNGTLTITNSAPGSSYTLPVAKNNVLGGIKTGYTESGGAEMAIYVLEDGTAYTLLKDTTVKTALGFTPANVNDIPEIPIALPNPYALNVTAGGSTTSYTGSSASTIDLDNIYAKNYLL